MAAGSWYVHLHDPQFFEPPWPGQRRIGPFRSRAQALEQAASDLAQGMGEGIIGVYTGTNSDAMREDDGLGDMSDQQKLTHAQDRKSVLSLVTEDAAIELDEIQARAEALQVEWDARAEIGLEEFREGFRATLPENLRDDEKLITALMKTARMI